VNYFCTYFDQHYLPRGLALIASLQQHCPAFQMWVLCLDTTCYERLEQLHLPELHLIKLNELEHALPELRAARENRTLIEYYFTCTPALPLYVLERHPQAELLTYLDADMYFFDDPRPVLQQIAEHSITIVEHRYPGYLRDMEQYGRYNVGLLAFRRDEQGLACLRLWFQQCVEWCYDRLDGDRYADQKYLEQWPRLFENVLVLKHQGVNLAPWNLMNYSFRRRGGRVQVGDQPLVLFHFHGFKRKRAWLYDTHTARYATRPPRTLQRHVYRPYIRALSAAQSAALAEGIRYASAPAEPEALGARMRRLAHYAVGILQGRYLVHIDRHVVAALALELTGYTTNPSLYTEWVTGLAPLAYHGGLF
jgi:hypothetical protein